jgi:hypothetical protein
MVISVILINRVLNVDDATVTCESNGIMPYDHKQIRKLILEFDDEDYRDNVLHKFNELSSNNDLYNSKGFLNNVKKNLRYSNDKNDILQFFDILNKSCQILKGMMKRDI